MSTLNSSTATLTASPGQPALAPFALTPVLGFKLILVSAFWGGTFIAGRVLAQSVPLMTAAFGRFVIAALLLLLVVYRLEGGLPKLGKDQLLTTAALGLTGIFLYNVFFFKALSHMPAGRTALFVGLNPVMTGMAARVVFKERLGLRRWVGIALALLGSMVVITRGDLLSNLWAIGQSFGPGETSMSLAVLSWAAYSLISRKALQSMSPIAATTYASLWGLGFLFLGALTELPSVTWSAFGWDVWVSLFYTGAIGTVVAVIWFYEGIRAIGPSRAAVFTNLVPAFGVLLSALILGEHILVSVLVGGAITICGVTLANRK